MADNTFQLDNHAMRDIDRSGVHTGVSSWDIAQAGDSELIGIGYPKIITLTSAGLTTASTAYTAGDMLGTEMTITGATREASRGSIITSATLVDKAKVLGAVDLFIFDRSVSQAANNAANAWSDADMLFLLGIISFETPIVSANNSVARGVAGLPLVVRGNASVDLKAGLVTRNGHTWFGAVGDIQIALGIEQF